MKKWVLAICLLVMTSSAYANWYQDIINAINKQGGLTNSLLGNVASQQGQMLLVNQDIDSLMRELNTHVVGHSGWGDYGFHDYQSYGDSAKDWSRLMNMAENGHGNGELGRAMGGIANQFPLDNSTFKRGVSDPTARKYYALKSQSILAVRAASQLDYDKIQEQIAYQQMLQKQIEKTADLKAAMDLSNRIQVEGNLINLEILRQAALANQQQAITEQAAVNSALSNARFLTKQ